MSLWDPSLSLGIPEIDESHECTLAQMERVLEAIAEQDAGRTETLLCELASDVTRRFEREEALAPALPRDHIDGHRLFIAELERLRDAFSRRGLAPALPVWIQSRIVNGYKFHIGTHDVALAAALCRSAARAEPNPSR